MAVWSDVYTGQFETATDINLVVLDLSAGANLAGTTVDEWDYYIVSVDADNAVAPGEDDVAIVMHQAGDIEGLVFWGGNSQPVKSWASDIIVVGPVDGSGLDIGSTYDWEVWRPGG
jgi:hypothetical protein